MKLATADKRALAFGLTLGGFVLAVFFAVAMMVMALGCVPAELVKQAQLSEVRCARFVELMDQEETQRQEEQEFIKACGVMFTAIRDATGAEKLGGE